MKHAMISVISMHSNDPGGFMVRAYEKTEKEMILEYMGSFDPYAVAGMVYDCITRQKTKEENVGFSDGTFSWSSQDIYHLERYDAAVSEDFIQNIMK